MDRRIHVRARVFIEGHFVRIESIFSHREALPNLNGLIEGIHREARREGVRKVIDVAKTLRHPERLLLRAEIGRRQRDADTHRRDESTPREFAVNFLHDGGRTHMSSLEHCRRYAGPQDTRR
jgi:hypothetical protein